MKKLFSVLAVVISLIAVIMCVDVIAVSAKEEIDVSAKSAYLLDYDSGTVIYAKNENDKLPIASVTKLMLLNFCFEKLDSGEYSLSDNITVSKTASGMGGSQVFLEANKQYKAADLIKSIIVASANDASVAMAERLFGSESECVNAMNERCKEWGLNNTLFSNCTGLTKPTQYSCAKDVSVMLEKLIAHKEYFDFSTIWLDEINHGDRKTEIANTNKLIRFYEGCDGGKTGFTSESGFCLAATARRGGTRLISVAIKADNSKSRFADISNMFDFGFANYTSKCVIDSAKPLSITAEVKKGETSSIRIRAEKDAKIFCKKGSKDEIMIDFVPNSRVAAPIKKGDVIGELVVYRDNVETVRVNAVADENVAKKTYFGYIKDVAREWFF